MDHSGILGLKELASIQSQNLMSLRRFWNFLYLSHNLLLNDHRSQSGEDFEENLQYTSVIAFAARYFFKEIWPPPNQGDLDLKTGLVDVGTE